LELDRVRNGDPTAFRVLVRTTWAGLVGYARRITRSEDLAQDIAQEALVRLWEHRERWGEGSARAVLFRIARNLALDECRKAEVRSRSADAVAAEASAPVPTPEDELRASGLHERVAAAVASLPARRREVFELIRREGLSYREASDVMGVSAQTVANQMRLAMRDLRALLVDVLDQAPPDAGAEDRRTVDG